MANGLFVETICIVAPYMLHPLSCSCLWYPEKELSFLICIFSVTVLAREIKLTKKDDLKNTLI